MVLSPTAIKDRARALAEAMQARGRWTYAVPLELPRAELIELMSTSGYVSEKCDWPGGWRGRFGGATLTLRPEPELDVTLLVGEGAEVVPAMAQALEMTEFYAQSALLETALDLEDPEAPQALETLAHMACAWDEGWASLVAPYLLHSDPTLVEAGRRALATIAELVPGEGPRRLLDQPDEL